jgi:hypothetical protein
MEMIEQPFNFRVLFQIDIGVRVPVAREECFNANGIGGVAGAQYGGISDALSQQLRPPENERAHHDFA